MFFIPVWISNLLLIGTCWLAGFQLMKLKRPNPIMNIQFMMIVFCLLVTVTATLYRGGNPWVSLVFLLIAIGSLGVMLRQQRMPPPSNPVE